MFCLPQSTAFCTVGSPGSESWVFSASCSPGRHLGGQLAGRVLQELRQALLLRLRAALVGAGDAQPDGPRTVGGQRSVYVSSPPVPLPNGPSSHAEGLGSAGAPGSVPVHRCPGCGP